MERKRQVVLASVAGLLILSGVIAWGCGPWFPESYLVSGNEQRVLAIPEGRFNLEAARLLHPPAPQPENNVLPRSQGRQTSLTGDLADLKAALEATMSDPVKRDALLKAYEAMRQAIKAGTKDYTVFSERERGIADKPFDLTPYQSTLAALPAEFSLYARGAAAYRANEFTTASAILTELLKLPRERRFYRSTWAAFMLGKAALVTAPQQAPGWFEQTRKLAGEGFKDTLGLASDSWGWQARAERKLHRPAEAIQHYQEQLRSGADWNHNVLSLRLAAGDLASSPTLFLEALKNPTARKVAGIYVLTRDDGKWLEGWVRALQTANVTLDTTETDQLAWAWYRQGNMTKAAQWLGRSATHSPVGDWVRAKMMLRAGKIDDGLKLLKSLVPRLPENEEWYVDDFDHPKPVGDVRAEIGVLVLGSQDYLAALDTFARSGYWEDTAYIAERVLTVKELEGYIKAHADDETLSRTVGMDDVRVTERLRWLLARRLARGGQWAEARAYYPVRYVGTMDDYVAALKAGHDKNANRRARAEALFKAGMIARKYGMELLGTENEPDWTLYDGQFERDEAAGTKMRMVDKATSLPLELRQPALVKALSAGAGEKSRVRSNTVKPEKRFHYRYAASNLMWECAALLPDNDPLTAAALYDGGSWHKTRDEPFADKFYQALVRRCPKLPIGQEAEKVKWFPANPPPPPSLRIVEP